MRHGKWSESYSRANLRECTVYFNVPLGLSTVWFPSHAGVGYDSVRITLSSLAKTVLYRLTHFLLLHNMDGSCIDSLPEMNESSFSHGTSRTRSSASRLQTLRSMRLLILSLSTPSARPCEMGNWLTSRACLETLCAKALARAASLL